MWRQKEGYMWRHVEARGGMWRHVEARGSMWRRKREEEK